MSDARVQSKASSGLGRASLPPWDVVAESLSQYREKGRASTLSAVITSIKERCRRIEGRNVPGNAVERGVSGMMSSLRFRRAEYGQCKRSKSVPCPYVDVLLHLQ